MMNSTMDSTIDSTMVNPNSNSVEVEHGGCEIDQEVDGVIIETKGRSRTRWTVIAQAFAVALVLFLALIFLLPGKNNGSSSGSASNVDDSSNDNTVKETLAPNDEATILNGDTGWRQIGQDLVGDEDVGVIGEKVAMAGNGLIIATTVNTQDFTTSFVRVWLWSQNTWVQQGQDLTGNNAVLSKDGLRIAVGIRNGPSSSVQVYHWDLDADTWRMTGNALTGYDGQEGLAISSDGGFVAVGYKYDNSNTGRVIVYRNVGENWTQLTPLVGDSEGEYFGKAISLSKDGKRLAVSSHNWGMGHVKMYEMDGGMTSYSRIGQRIEGDEEDEQFGFSLTLSMDGSTVAIGAYKSQTVGGAIVFRWTTPLDEQASWKQLGSELFGQAKQDEYGGSIAISDDGNRVVIGGDNNDLGADEAGFVRTFDWTGYWEPYSGGGALLGDIKNDNFGRSVGISVAGDRIIVGIPGANCNGRPGSYNPNCGMIRVYEQDENFN